MFPYRPGYAAGICAHKEQLPEEDFNVTNAQNRITRKCCRETRMENEVIVFVDLYADSDYYDDITGKFNICINLRSRVTEESETYAVIEETETSLARCCNKTELIASVLFLYDNQIFNTTKTLVSFFYVRDESVFIYTDGMEYTNYEV